MLRKTRKIDKIVPRRVVVAACRGIVVVGLLRCVVGPEVRCGGEAVAGHALADGLQDVALQGLIGCGGGGADVGANGLSWTDVDAVALSVVGVVVSAFGF